MSGLLVMAGLLFASPVVYTISYDTKFWREKILANLANSQSFAKIFLSKIFSSEKFVPVIRNGTHMCELVAPSHGVVEIFQAQDFS